MFLNIFMSVLSAVLEFLFLGVFRWGRLGGGPGHLCRDVHHRAFGRGSLFYGGKTSCTSAGPRFSVGMIRQIIACGSPNFLNNIAGRITSILLNAILVRMGGETAVSVYGVLMYTDGFIQPLLYGMCDSLQPAVGYNWGAGKISRVRAIEKCCFIASGIISLLAVVVILLFPGAKSPACLWPTPVWEVMALSIGALQLFAITYITRWFSFATQSYMLAIEKAPARLYYLCFHCPGCSLCCSLGCCGLWA